MLCMKVQWNPSFPDTLGTALRVQNQGDVLTSCVVLYTSVYTQDHACVLIKGSFQECPYKGVPLYALSFGYKHARLIIN